MSSACASHSANTGLQDIASSFSAEQPGAGCARFVPVQQPYAGETSNVTP